ncbi:MAG TPA: thioredoxin family protein [Oscillospiraceae bacterium]|nr:thioredoxin family protein [Oscillospiraceae bacterium]
MTAASKKSTVKVLVPVLLLALVFGVWYVKNAQSDKIPTGGVNPDFALAVTEEFDLEHLKSYGLPIMLDFGSDDCAPCQAMAPVLEELNLELQGKAIIKFIDVWKYEELGQDYPLTLIPTQVFIDAEGKPYTPSNPKAMEMTLFTHRETNEHLFTTHVGPMTKEEILAALAEMGMK